MRAEAVEQLRSPESATHLEIKEIVEQEEGEIKTGELRVTGSYQTYPISNFIPRFVQDDSYTSSFGEQWNRYRRTQLDRYNGTKLSYERFFRDTKWTPDELRGQRVIEAGCGAGRFTHLIRESACLK